MVKVLESAAAQSLRVQLVMLRGEIMAYVYAHFANSGRVTVEVYDACRCLIHKRTADGGGYDKFTAALAGCVIDSHKLCDHCGERLVVPDCGYFARDFDCPAGYSLANYMREVGGYRDCYKRPGLDYLKDIGFDIITVL